MLDKNRIRSKPRLCGIGNWPAGHLADFKAGPVTMPLSEVVQVRVVRRRGYYIAGNHQK
jgi:hypothetical protein